jgi:hypothetical protein
VVVEQPEAFVPVTVYVVVVVGETEIILVVCPVFQEYVNPLVAVSVIVVPAQIVLFELVIFTVGFEATVIVFVAVLVQPAALVPVIV